MHENLAAPYWRLYWNAEAGWGIRLGDAVVGLGPERLIAIPPDTPFAARSRNACDHLYVHFVADAPYDTVPSGIHEVPLNGSERTLVRELASRAARGETASGRGSVLVTLHCFRALASIPLEHVMPQRYSAPVRSAMTLMQNSLGRSIANAVLAREAGMSTNAFIRLFAADVGEPPQRWYLRRRIDYACELLHHSDMSMDHIADATGFCDRAHFARTFSRLRGMGPATFRRRGPQALVATDR